MKEKRLSLDELILLGEEFHRLNKWRVEESSKSEVIFVTEKINNLYMSLYINYNSYHNNVSFSRGSIFLNELRVENKKSIEVELGKYQSRVYENDFENEQKLRELEKLIEKKAYAFSELEEKKKQKSELARERKEKEKKNRAVETARKLINKSQYK